MYKNIYTYKTILNQIVFLVSYENYVVCNIYNYNIDFFFTENVINNERFFFKINYLSNCCLIIFWTLESSGDESVNLKFNLAGSAFKISLDGR